MQPLTFELWRAAVDDYLKRTYGRSLADFNVCEDRLQDEHELDCLYFADTGEAVDFRDYAEQLMKGDRIEPDPTIA